MRPTDREKCGTCGRHRDEVGRLSHTGQCIDCGNAAQAENATGISTHCGPAFLRWRRRMAASVGAVLLEDLEAYMELNPPPASRGSRVAA